MSRQDPRGSAEDHCLALAIATEAGGRLVRLRTALEGEPDHVVRARGDSESQKFITAALSASRPDDAVLSEEGADDPARLSCPRVWVVDPLDGTREFGERGRTDWAVHVALVCGTDVVAGAVALPAQQVAFSTAEPPVAPVNKAGPLRLVVSRSRAPAVATLVAERLGADLLFLGSAGVKAMAVVRGDADVYLHGGGQYEWDSAAPVAVALAAGLHASRLDGSPLRYNQQTPWLPDLLICRAELVSEVRRALSGATSAGRSRHS